MKLFLKKGLVLFTLTSMLTTNVFANNVILNDNIADKSNIKGLYASEYIGSYYSNFSSVGKGKLSISLMLTCGVKVDELSISVSLKEKIGSDWYQIAQWSESAVDDYIINLDRTYVATHTGSEYQIDVTYKAKKGSKVETRYVTRNTVS